MPGGTKPLPEPMLTSDVHLRAISLEISQPSVTKISFKIIFLRFYWNLPGANELMETGDFDTDHMYDNFINRSDPVQSVSS